MNALEMQFRFCNEGQTVHDFSLDWDINKKKVSSILQEDTTMQLHEVLSYSPRPSYIVELFDNAKANKDNKKSLHFCLVDILDCCSFADEIAQELVDFY